MQDITLTLTVEETNFVMQVLGELPSRTGSWPVMVKIQNQVKDQLSKNEEQFDRPPSAADLK